MSRRLRILRIVMGLKLIGSMLLMTPLAAEPRSGVIIRHGSKVLFDARHTRTETYWDGKLTSIFTSGRLGAWEAYPHIGRVVIHPIPEPNYWVPYAEHWRRVFGSGYGGGIRVRVGEEEHLGLTCWRYEWVETNHPSIHPPPPDGEVPTRKVQALFLADDSFPLLMRWGSDGVWESKSDVLDLTLDGPVPAAVFEPPAGLKQTKAFRIPRELFELLM